MLSDAMIRSLKAGPKPTKHADGGGLFILVNPDGKKHWRLSYRFAGKQKLLSGWPFPIVKLADARKWRDEAKAHLLEGRDPSMIRKAEKKALAAKGQDAFEIVAREWLHTRSKVCPSICADHTDSKSDVISENRMLDILYRMGLRGKATVHGFRGLASTVLNESGEFEPDWIEVQLAHVARGVRAAYNSARYLAHRRIMMQWWADYLERAEKAGLSGHGQAAR